ncbi:DEAD/DEAH box helicase family protein [Comamonas sp. Y6]|uniref:DEAD/DEAH box helicase family protein n=1 Tax=Comamonas resistens TaxID=3046670 RepID=A0ABY8SYX1_9BURK|nr:DEAD/DEAH box helicase family protein [Comamonas resistens]MDL5037808.1 DEAD/DEAH box helicase family protein [Comamonas resistens]WHS67625.1 DEAD/DEAH box helicase family protein [Comamonas resistens]
MSNFQFLHPEFRTLQEPAAGAEQLVQSDPRASAMRARHALEQTVLWLYDNDSSLRMPYDQGLNTLMTQREFAQLVPPHVLDKMHLIKRQGNQAVHGNRSVPRVDAMALVQELFHVLFWLARTYTRASDPKHIAATWDTGKIPFLVNAEQAATEAVQFTKDELKKQEAKFQAQLAAQRAELEKREAAMAAQATTLAEREAALADVDAELAQRRAELAQAKAAALAVPDAHDYNEAETRKRLIDLMLAEAGWTLDAPAATPPVKGNASVEVPVQGMPSASGTGYADYVLWAADGKPAAVVEAKRSLKDAEVGRQQAKLYADALQAQHGQRPLIFYTNGHRTFLWDDQRYPAPREVQGFYTQDELALALVRRQTLKPLARMPIKAEIVERVYQTRAIRAITEAFTHGRRRALLTMATGTGKTRVAVALADVLMQANWAKRVLFLADRVSLVNQATNKGFKPLLPNTSVVNLLNDKNGQGRVYLSTYPTMMGLIDEMEGGQRRFGVGHFDLIIVDEAHRSVYQKYGAIFKYFDSLLVGLTATPREEVDRDTYHLFGLETGVPTDAYSLDEAVSQGFLVPHKAMSVPLKFVRSGIRYDELSPEEKEHWESLDWGDDGPPEEVSAGEINKFLFNEDTVDKMLKHLMENGLKVDGGDRLGKTIIFAVNQKHADFIEKRFNHHYPHLVNSFARVITHQSGSYAQSLIDDFSKPASAPHIAISVDMLDTGIDVPEVLNLVFFKAVRSKVKFLQMIGRGTRLCENLFGPGQHKREFVIFDFCQNFEYFNENPVGAASVVAEPLGKRLFKSRLDLLQLLRTPQPGATPVAQEDLPAYHHTGDLQTTLAEQLHGEVAAMNQNNFIVRTELGHVRRFAERSAWDKLDDTAVGQLRNHVAGLPSQLESDHITARLFDLLCVNLQLALLRKEASFAKLRERVIAIAGQLELLANVPAVQAEMALLQEVQTEGYWVGITPPIIEHLRRHVRALVKFIERQVGETVYTVLSDEIGEATEVTLKDTNTGINLAQYKKKVEAFIRANAAHVAIAKLRLNKPLTPTDLIELERFVYEAPEVEGRERFAQSYGDKPLPQFIRSLVGMDRAEAQKAFARFLDANRYSSQQIRFVEMIIERLTAHGEVTVGQLYDPPFTAIHQEGLDGAFNQQDADALAETVNEMQRLVA